MRTKRFGPAILFITDDGEQGAIEYPADTHPAELTPAFIAACEAGFQHGDPLHLPDLGLDVTLLSKDPVG